MNSLLETELGRHDHPPHEVEQLEQFEVRRVGPLDRLALHLGVALLKWGRRPRLVESRERRATRVEHALARLERERSAERLLHWGTPRP